MLEPLPGAHPTDQSNEVSKNRRKHFATVILLSVPLLIPCFWQERIQATDLSSHIYNAWLSVLTAQGKLQGLYFATQHNNVLFDFALQWLLPRVGVSAAQRIAVSFAVLIFASGALALLTRVAGKNWWFSLPCVAMFSYGFVFHMGFFNYYISMGICMWYLAVVWFAGWTHQVFAIPLLLFGWIAHPLPVAWAAGTALYLILAKKVDRRHNLWLVLIGAAAILLARVLLSWEFRCAWFWSQIYAITGANEVMVFGPNFVLAMAPLLLLWLSRFRRLTAANAASRNHPALQLWFLNALAVWLIPNSIWFPQYALPFSFVTQRLSLGAAIMLCAWLGALPCNRAEKIGFVLVIVIFFGMLFMDTRKINRLEDEIDATVAQLPTGSRVLGDFPTRVKRVSPLLHALDRACIAHCFSYGNYEPSSRQFRLRARPGNPYVMSDYSDAYDVQMGKYIVQPRDLPAYLVYLCGEEKDHVCSRPLKAGDMTHE